MTEAKQINGVEPADRMLEDAAHDPCMPVRNLGGHIITCNYGDWPTFEKCGCAEGLAGTPSKPPTHVNVAPMPLRDFFATTIDVSYEQARELAEGIKASRMQQQRIISTIVGNDEPISVVDIADARAKLRYLEADAMCHWRSESSEIQRKAAAAAAAEREANPLITLDTKTPSGWVCDCGHEPERHGAVDRRQAIEMGVREIEGGACDECDCEAYSRAPSDPGATPTK
jgi:hypothetical protein